MELPALHAAWKFAPALAAGNSVTLKPAEQSPYTALRIAELAVEAGIPAGVFNVLSGYGETAGQALGRHMDVDCLAFTGSTGVAAGIFSNAGQVCNAGSRVVVQDGIKDKLLEKVVEKAREIVVGDPFDAATKMGPLVSAEQYERVLSYMETGLEQGATIATGGGKLNEETGGYYVAPTIFDNVNNDMRIAREEIFGPVLSVISVKDAEEAVKVPNDTDFGMMPRKSFHDAKHLFPQSIFSEMLLETLKSSVDDAVLRCPLRRPV